MTTSCVSEMIEKDTHAHTERERERENENGADTTVQTGDEARGGGGGEARGCFRAGPRRRPSRGQGWEGGREVVLYSTESINSRILVDSFTA